MLLNTSVHVWVVHVVVSKQQKTREKANRNIQIEQQHYRPHAAATNGLLAMHEQLQSGSIGEQ